MSDPFRRAVDPDGKFARAQDEAFGIPADQVRPEPGTEAALLAGDPRIPGMEE